MVAGREKVGFTRKDSSGADLKNKEHLDFFRGNIFAKGEWWWRKMKAICDNLHTPTYLAEFILEGKKKQHTLPSISSNTFD